MRVVGEISHPQCKITLFAWNNRYLIKVENGFLEQTYKINQFDIIDEKALPGILDDAFISECLVRFDEMARSLRATIERHDP